MNNKDANISLSNSCFHGSPTALCFFLCSAEFKTPPWIVAVTHSTLKAPWGQKPYFIHFCSKYGMKDIAFDIKSACVSRLVALV